MLRAHHWQHFLPHYKTNPDVHFSKLYQVQTNDRTYGLRQLPKRPWVSFKNPEKFSRKISDKNDN
jgi:hypothetical protein